MKSITSITKYAMTAALAGLLIAPSAFAERPEWSGDNRGASRDYRDQRVNREAREERRRDNREYREERRKDNREYREERRHDNREARDNRREKIRVGGHFDNRNRVIVRDYYHEHYRAGRCPPGLYRKHNGCMPPGQIRRWHLGRVLPRDVIYYDVPPALVVQLGHPPAGHRYVRVASDILLIAIGTGLVVDAINDLGGMQ